MAGASCKPLTPAGAPFASRQRAAGAPLALPATRCSERFATEVRCANRSFFFSRHGQSEYNRLGKIGGDSDLTEHGEAYALALGEWVAKNVMVDADGTMVQGLTEPLPSFVGYPNHCRLRTFGYGEFGYPNP